MKEQFKTLDGRQGVYINRAHQIELGENDSCKWIHLYGKEGADTKLIFYSQEELDVELDRVKCAIQAAKDAVGEWEAWNNGAMGYYVIRLKDSREPFHGGNFEYAHRYYKDEPEQYENLKAAQEAAARLNQLPKVEL